MGAGSSLNQNQQNVANAINNFFNSGGTLPPNFVECVRSDRRQSRQCAHPIGWRGGDRRRARRVSIDQRISRTDARPVRQRPRQCRRCRRVGAIGFAPDQQASLPPDIALAYASILNKAPPKPIFDQRWTAWGAAYGGSNSANGNAAIGSNNVTAQTFGFAGGMDYHFTPDTVVGFALAGGGTNWGLANALGTGRSDAFQAGGLWHELVRSGLCRRRARVHQSLVHDQPLALGDQLTANFIGQSYGARLEGGYRYAVLPAFGVTPYAALQAQDFHTPAYSETDISGGGFGLSYAAMNATDVRSELGARFDDPTLLYGKPLILFGRARLGARFCQQSCAQRRVSSRCRAQVYRQWRADPAELGAHHRPARNCSSRRAGRLLAKFDGEFAPGSQTYAGSGTLRYTW